MSKSRRSVSPLRRLVRAASRILFGHVALRRDGGSVSLTLVDRPAAPAAAPPPASALKRLLDAHPLSRKALKHLVYVEAVIAGSGLEALAGVPARVLAKALSQLEGLVGNVMPEDLVALGSALRAGAAERDAAPAAPAAPLDARPSDFHVGHKLQVSEGSLSSFFDEAAAP